MSPRKLSAGQRISSHFLEADHYYEDAVQELPAADGLRWPPLPTPGIGAAGVGGAFTAAAGVAGVGLVGIGGAGGPAAGRAYGGLVYGAAPPDRSAVIPPMKRRLITLPTAGNLRISPLSNQQLHPQRIYPVRRPSDFDGGAAAAAAPPDGAGAVLQEGGLLQQLLPPPPPGTPSRHAQPPSSHQFLERRELSPRDDNILQGGGAVHYHRRRRTSSPEQPPPPATPRRAGSRAGGGGGGGAFATPRLVLRPVRPLHQRSLGDNGALLSEAVVVEAPAAPVWSENLTSAQQQQQRHEPQILSLEAGETTPRCFAMCCGGSGGAAAGDDDPMQVDPAAGQGPHPCWTHHQAEQLPADAAAAPAADATADGDAMQGDCTAATDAAAAAAAADGDGGMAWMSIEVTVAVRPKAGAAPRRYQLHASMDAAGMAEGVHNGYVRGPAWGVFDLTRYLTGRDCVRHSGRWISRSQFEKLGGSTMAKWYRSIRVLPDLEPLGEWLERHGMPVTKGPARRSRKRTTVDSGDELGGGGGWDAADDGAAAAPWGVAAAEGGQGAATAGAAPPPPPPPDTWANRMLLQHRDGSGDDLLVQRLLSTWPLSQPFMRPPAAAAAPASGAVGALAGPLRSFADIHRQVMPSSPAGQSQQQVPPTASAVGASQAGVSGTVGPAGTTRDADAAMLAAVPEIKCTLPSSALPCAALPSLAGRARAGAEGHPGAQQWPQLPQESAEQAEQAGGGVVMPPPPPPLQPPTRRRCDAAGPALLRPRLLLHRTAAAAASTDGRRSDQPYLFAVQAPPGMLYREGGSAAPSPLDATVEAGCHAMDE